MESVLHTLIIILFILIPGFIFRRVYYQGGFSKQFDSKSWSHSIFYSIIFGITIELIALWIFSKIVTPIKGDSIIEFYQCMSTDEIPLWIFDAYILKNLLYFFIILFLVAFLFAQISYNVVRLFKLDKKFLFLRFNNHWHYYFTGEIKDFKEYRHINGKFKCAYLDVLVNTEDGNNRLYSGFLASHTINGSTGDLEAIYLTFPRRYDKLKEIWKDIKSDVLIIPYSKVINLNINYSFEEKKPLNISLRLVTVLILILGSIFIWWDYFGLLSQYTLFSNFIIKYIFQSLWISIFQSISLIGKLKKSFGDERKKTKKELIANTITFFIFTIIITAIFVVTY